MAWIDAWIEQLDAEMQSPTTPVAIIAYAYRLEERTTVTRDGVIHLTTVCHLTVFWEDGSVSSHTHCPPLPKDGRVPVSFWYSVRFLNGKRQRLPGPHAPVIPDIPVCDSRVVSIIREGTPGHFAWLDGWELVWQKQTVGHSRGFRLHAEMTEVRLHTPQDPFLYESRRLPNETEAEFLEAESAWFRLQPVSWQGVRTADIRQTTLLLAPPALRRLLAVCAQAVTMDPEARNALWAFLQQSGAPSRLHIRYDPLVPWAIGSHPFTPEGLPSRTCDLLNEPEMLPPDPVPSSFHWTHGQPGLPFRQWLSGQPDVLYVPDCQLPPLAAPLQTGIVWIPCAWRFRNGRPAEQGSISLPLSLARLLTNEELQLVHRPGWDTDGLALPYASLLHE